MQLDPKLAAMRQEYTTAGLSEDDLLEDPIRQFERWFDDAHRAGIYEPNAMVLATVDADGQPSSRMVLLKGLDRRGLAFYTNLGSRKARALRAEPRASLMFWWGPLERQVRFEGRVERVADEEADAYFASRPRDSQIGAWASEQSAVIAGRPALDEAERRYRERFGTGEVPRPDFWGGFRLAPQCVEFWQGRRSRLHDRLCYRRSDGHWIIERLQP